MWGALFVAPLETIIISGMDKQKIMTMKTELNFKQDTTKKLLSQLGFEFFLKQNIEKGKYKQEDIDEIYSSYRQTLIQINAKTKENKKQFNFYSEGQVRKMFKGGLLP